MLMGGLILEEEGRSYELHGEQAAAELCVAAVAFWGVGVGEKRKSSRISLLGYL